LGVELGISLAFVVTTTQIAVETAFAVFGSKTPAEYADEHANEDDGDGGEKDMPPGHIQGHLIRLVLAIRSAVPLLDKSNALTIVASPHLLTILLGAVSAALLP